MTSSIPVTPTPAMRRFLNRLARAPHGKQTRAEMGHPAYPMPYAMERAGWITCTYWRSTHPGLRNQIWGHPRTYRITRAGRKALTGALTRSPKSRCRYDGGTEYNCVTEPCILCSGPIK